MHIENRGELITTHKFRRCQLVYTLNWWNVGCFSDPPPPFRFFYSNSDSFEASYKGQIQIRIKIKIKNHQQTNESNNDNDNDNNDILSGMYYWSLFEEEVEEEILIISFNSNTWCCYSDDILRQQYILGQVLFWQQWHWRQWQFHCNISAKTDNTQLRYKYYYHRNAIRHQ